MSHSIAWIALVVAGLLDVGWAISMKYAEGYTRLGWTLVSLLLLAALLPWARLSRAQWALLVGAPIIFFLITFAISFEVPVLMPRITIWLSVPLCVLAACVLPRARWFAVPLAACILLGLHGVYAGTVTVKEDWRGLAAELGPRIGPDDIVVVGPSTSTIALGF